MAPAASRIVIVVRAILVLLPTCLVAWLCSLALAGSPAVANGRVVRSCGRGEIQEYPYFNIRAQGTSCRTARHLIRTFLCTNANGHCAPGSHWSIRGNVQYGRWTSPSGWRCTARIPPALHVDGRPFGSERCQRGQAWVESQSFG